MTNWGGYLSARIICTIFPHGQVGGLDVRPEDIRAQKADGFFPNQADEKEILKCTPGHA